MKKILKSLFLIILILGIFIYLSKNILFKKILENKLTETNKGKVTIGSLNYNIFSSKLLLKDVKIYEGSQTENSVNEESKENKSNEEDYILIEKIYTSFKINRKAKKLFLKDLTVKNLKIPESRKAKKKIKEELVQKDSNGDAKSKIEEFYNEYENLESIENNSKHKKDGPPKNFMELMLETTEKEVEIELAKEEKFEKERKEAERLEKERIEKEKIEQEKLEKERELNERIEQEKLEKERLKKEKESETNTKNTTDKNEIQKFDNQKNKKEENKKEEDKKEEKKSEENKKEENKKEETILEKSKNYLESAGEGIKSKIDFIVSVPGEIGSKLNNAVMNKVLSNIDPKINDYINLKHEKTIFEIVEKYREFLEMVEKKELSDSDENSDGWKIYLDNVTIIFSDEVSNSETTVEIEKISSVIRENTEDINYKIQKNYPINLSIIGNYNLISKTGEGQIVSIDQDITKINSLSEYVFSGFMTLNQNYKIIDKDIAMYGNISLENLKFNEENITSKSEDRIAKLAISQILKELDLNKIIYKYDSINRKIVIKTDILKEPELLDESEKSGHILFRGLN